MSQFLKTFFMAGLPFGILMGAIFSFMYGASTGIWAGLFSGIFFGLGLAAFVSYQAKRFTSNRPLDADEKLIKEGGANHFLNGESVGGWIYLTDRRFYFKSHGSNIQNHEFIVPLSEIADAKKVNNALIIPNGLQLVLKDQKTERFVVSGAADWVKEITALIRT